MKVVIQSPMSGFRTQYIEGAEAFPPVGATVMMEAINPFETFKTKRYHLSKVIGLDFDYYGAELEITVTVKIEDAS